LLVWPIAAFDRPGTAPRARVALPVARPCDAITRSPDATKLAVTCKDGSVYLYDMPGVTLAKTITVHKDEVTQAAFSPDGLRLATASMDRAFHVSPLRFDDLHAAAVRLQAATAGER
jgi:WD40 repeat protein